eukprot:TRINITY_DN53222_c0_g4_i1.p1 TRINITY_DN53222_c0_g4~~TRINITY_DN53222_c0_g4_i1.p1  ORF type:complete len:109 (-),score=26.68 TRINITY_DN53222_c0_g4_i1:10-315(-)
MAPFTPFLVENMYGNLKKALGKEDCAESIHFLSIPNVDEKQRDEVMERQVACMQTVIDLGRAARQKANITFRMPIKKIVIGKIGRAVQQECRDRSRMPSSA